MVLSELLELCSGNQGGQEEAKDGLDTMANQIGQTITSAGVLGARTGNVENRLSTVGT